MGHKDKKNTQKNFPGKSQEDKGNNGSNKNKVKIAERIKQAWTLYREGFDYRTIAEKLKYSKSQAQRDVEGELEEWLKQSRKEAAKIKIREYLKLQRLDEKVALTFNSLGTTEYDQDKIVKEVEARTKISSLIFKLFGLDKIIIEQPGKDYSMSIFTDNELLRITQGEKPEKILAERINSEIESAESNRRRNGSGAISVEQKEKVKDVKRRKGKD